MEPIEISGVGLTPLDAVSLEQQRSDTDNGSSSDTFQDKLGTEEERYELLAGDPVSGWAEATTEDLAPDPETG